MAPGVPWCLEASRSIWLGSHSNQGWREIPPGRNSANTQLQQCSLFWPRPSWLLPWPGRVREVFEIPFFLNEGNDGGGANEMLTLLYEFKEFMDSAVREELLFGCLLYAQHVKSVKPDFVVRIYLPLLVLYYCTVYWISALGNVDLSEPLQ